MGKTKKGSKPPGYEYWSARPGNRHGGTVGRFTKKQTHKAERADFDAEKVATAISGAIRSGACYIYVDTKTGEVQEVDYDEFNMADY